MAGSVKSIICAIDKAIENLDESQKLTDESFCKKEDSKSNTQVEVQDWSKLPKICPEMWKLKTADVRQALYLHYTGEVDLACNQKDKECNSDFLKSKKLECDRNGCKPDCNLDGCGIEWSNIDLLSWIPKELQV